MKLTKQNLNFAHTRALWGGLCAICLILATGPVYAESQSSCRDNAAKAVSVDSGKQPSPVSITADHIEFPQRNVVLLKGYTQMIRGGQRVFADELLYNKGDQSVEARGLVKLETPTGDSIRTSVLHYDMTKERAESGPATFALASRDADAKKSNPQKVSAHGTAERVEIRGENEMYLEQVMITTCLDGKDDVTFKADSLKIDQETGFRIANRAKVQILAPDRHPQVKEMLN